MNTRQSVLLGICFAAWCSGMVCLSAEVSALPAPYSDPRAYQVLDTWTEALGFGSNRTALTKYKVQHLATGKGQTLSVDGAVRALSDAEVGSVRAKAYADRIHPDLLAQFVAAGDALDAERRLPVIVWFRMARTEEKAIRSLWDRAQEPDEAHPAVEDDIGAEEAQRRLQAVRAQEAGNRIARARISERYVAAADAFIRQAGIPAERVAYRYQFAPAVIARLTLAECRQLEKSGRVNFLFPERQATMELDVVVPASRGYTGQKARYNGNGVTIGHIEPPG